MVQSTQNPLLPYAHSPSYLEKETTLNGSTSYFRTSIQRLILSFWSTTSSPKLNQSTSSAPITSQKSSPWLITLVVIFYFLTSLSVVFLNKLILSGVRDFYFPFPLIVTWFQIIVALVILVVSGELGKR